MELLSWFHITNVNALNTIAMYLCFLNAVFFRNTNI